MNYQILEHSGDLKIKVWGKSLEELFKNSAEAMYGAACGRKFKIQKCLPVPITIGISKIPYRIAKCKIKEVVIKGSDYENLLINFLNELLYLSDTQNKGFYPQNLVFGKKGDNLTLSANLLPFPFLIPELEIKSATYHNLKVEKKDDLYQTTIVFDI